MKKVGIIGCGSIARVHAWALGAIREVKISAFCDIDIQKAKELSGEVMARCQEEGQEGDEALSPLVCEDWKSLLEADLDVVHVCTPHFLHAPMAAELLKKGKAVFVEKPCAISVEQFEELCKVDALYPGKLGFCFQNRYNETTLLLQRIAAEGEIGRILGGRAFVTWKRDDGYYTGSGWKGQLLTEGGGALINQSIHTLDLLLRFLGEPIAVKGSIANHHLKNPGIEVEDTVEAWMEFADGARACFYASNGYAADAPVLLELQGDKGRVCMNGSEVTVFRDGSAPRHFDCETGGGIGKSYWGCGHRACIADFYECLESGAIFQNSLAGVRNTFMTMMEIYHSREERTRRI